MENVIQLKKRNTLKFEIVDEEGNKTGENLEFDLENIEMPLIYQDCINTHMKNVQNLEMKFIAIDKKQDVSSDKEKGVKFLTRNEEEKLKVLKEYYQKEMDNMDRVLGKNGCKKLLNGREPYFSMFDDVNDILKPILPKLKIQRQNILNQIKEKYHEKEENVIE